MDFWVDMKRNLNSILEHIYFVSVRSTHRQMGPISDSVEGHHAVHVEPFCIACPGDFCIRTTNNDLIAVYSGSSNSRGKFAGGWSFLGAFDWSANQVEGEQRENQTPKRNQNADAIPPSQT